MSNISTVHDQILTRLGFLCSSNTSYLRIPDPYDLTNNGEIFLRKGYGLKYDGASPSESEFNQYAFSHTFTVVLTRELLKLEGQTSPDDDITKAFLEDTYRIQNDFNQSNELGIDSNIRMITLGANSPIEKINGDQVKFKSIEISFEFLICEDY